MSASATPAAADPEVEPRYCTRHPDRETLVACGRCGRPFCPECLIHTPAGQRCYECAGVRRDFAQRAAARRFAQAAGAVALGAFVAGLLGTLFSLIAAVVAGGVAGQAIGPSINRRSRRLVYLLGFLSIVAGALAGSILVLVVRLASQPVSLDVKLIVAAASTIVSPMFWVFVVIATLVAYQRAR